jgi:glucose/mannose-6-phosphate isomerase
VIDLDDVQALREHDPSDMLGTVAGLPEQCRTAYDGAVALALPSAEGVTALTYCGMGGSAVAGDILRAVFRERLGIPVDVNRGPELPEYAGPSSLVVISSYSGGTAETLEAFREAVRRGCRLLAVTSGGTLASEAAEVGAPVVYVPGGFLPRAALGHISFSVLGALEAMGLLPPLADDVEETVTELSLLAGRLGPDAPERANPAKAIATLIGDRVPVVWGAEGIGAVAAMRWKTQLNENGKVPAFWASMSELNHNEVVGWTRPYGERFSLVALRHEGEHPEIAGRFSVSYEIAREAGLTTEEVAAAGRSALARLLSLVVAGDFTSTYVGLRRGVDPSPIQAIDRLKRREQRSR